MTDAVQPPMIGIVSLGCPKALVDSERILTRLANLGYGITADYADADAVMVNTCGFLNSSIEESLEAIAEAIAENGTVIVTGCLGSTPEKIAARGLKVTAVTGAHQYDQVVSAVRAAVPLPADAPGASVSPEGLRLTPPHYAYLKIGEGCSGSCTYCVIPKLRGPITHRPFDEVMAEARALEAADVRELLVVAQDTAQYKSSDGKNIVDLCKELGKLDMWVRLHYTYPYKIVDELIPLMADGLILPYLDVPMQHAAPDVLKRMKRPGDVEGLLRRIESWRKIAPDLTLRSSFIVGFPGETEDDFELLLDFIKEAKLDRVGCFQYEAIADTAAALMRDQIPAEVKEDRWHRFMQAQQEVSAAKMAAKVGMTLPVIIDALTEDGGIGRTQGDAPDIDGIVYVDGWDLRIGDVVPVKITDSDPYDLWGETDF